MKKIVLYTHQSAIKKHWTTALEGEYDTFVIESQAELLDMLAQSQDAVTVMVDEDSLEDLQETVPQLKQYDQATLLFFKSVPEVHHASIIIGQNVKAYENAFIHKDNLLLLLHKIEKGKSWLFTDLMNHIISKFIQDNNSSNPAFMSQLTQTEKDIAIMVANGLSNKEIAKIKGIALSTVKGHMQHIFRKAGVSDRISLALQFK